MLHQKQDANSSPVDQLYGTNQSPSTSNTQHTSALNELYIKLQIFHTL